MNRQNLSRRDFIKATTALIGGLIGVGIGLPTIAYLLSPSLRKTENESRIDLGPLDKYPLGIPTLFEFTRTKVNGWERTGLSYGVFVLRQTEKDVRVFSDICTHLACRVSWLLINSITSVPAMMDTSISWATTSAALRRAHWMNL